MSDVIAAIDKVITEHHDIRANLKHADDSVTDIDALFILRRASSAWGQSSIREFKEKQGQLLEAIVDLGQGLKRHFGFEEKALPPLLGEVLMKTLIFEHGEIARQIATAQATLADSALEGLSQQELLTRKARIQYLIHNIVQAVEEHAEHEEMILNMIKKALEA